MHTISDTTNQFQWARHRYHRSVMVRYSSAGRRTEALVCSIIYIMCTYTVYFTIRAVMVVSSEAIDIQMAGVLKVLPEALASRLRLLLGDT